MPDGLVSLDDVDQDFLVLEVPPSLRGSIEICSLGGTISPRISGLEKGVPQVTLWA